MWKTLLLFSILVIGVGFSTHSLLTRLYKNETVHQEQIPLIVETPLQERNKGKEEATAKEKISQLLAISLTLQNGASLEKITNRSLLSLESIAQIQPGFVILYGSALSHTTTQKITSSIQRKATVSRIFIAVDHEGGPVQRLSGSGFTKLQSWEHLCLLPTAEREQIFSQSAQELQAAGIDMVLGPVVDTSLTSNPVLYSRLCLGESDSVVEKTLEVLEAYQRQNITPVLKHYPGIGTLTTDLHNQYAEVILSPDTKELYNTLLTLYPEIAVMSSHAGLAGTNLPCSLDRECLSFLSQYPSVLILTDDIKMDSLYRGTLEENTLQAILAGNDVVLLGPALKEQEVEELLSKLVTQYETEPSFHDRVNVSYEKVLQWKATQKNR